MIKQFLTLVFALFAFSVYAQELNPGGATLSVDTDVYDYGTIKKNANGTATFTITNTGTSPLIIENAKGSCGCTVPEWPKKPIPPGGSETMLVKYDTKRVGPINKSVTIKSNDAANPTKVVRIKGMVEDTEGGTTAIPERKVPMGAPITN
ncbi:MAG: DUF1573 domain-containing protein [Luteibaculaceae bacterium]